MKAILKSIGAALLSVLFLFVLLLSPSLGLVAHAESAAEFEKVNVLDDLKDAEIDGEPFSLEKYGFNHRKETQVFSFVEFCYSFYENLQEDYGLYLYIYNPKGLHFAEDSELNKVNLRAGDNVSASFKKYPLVYLNQSEEADYEGLFYKFKVWLTEEEKQEILDTVNSSNRIYRVAEIELLAEGNLNATAIPVATTYFYKGYAGGYGSKADAESTLTCNSEQSDTLSLKPYTTTYRPSGSNGKGNCTQDSLHSVYFAVPKEFINRYGEMSAVHATWLNAVLAPALVTGNEEAYNAILNYLGVNIGTHTEGLDFHYYGDYERRTSSGMGSVTEHTYGFGYNAVAGAALGLFYDGDTEFKKDDGSVIWSNPKEGYNIETLYTMYYAGAGTDSADGFEVSSDMIRDKLLQGTQKYGGALVNGKYSRVLFERVDEKFTEVNIRRDETFDLTSQTISKSWWDKLWNLKGDVSTTVFDGIQAIYPVKKDDLSGGKEEVCKRLYISTADYDAFKKHFEENEANSTVYLFRYQVSDYISQEASLYKGSGAFSFKQVDTNAYFFQETVNLDYDIIDVTFSNGETETVIPVVMSPIDHIPSATPPIHTTSDVRSSWWKILLGVIALVFIVVLLLKFAPWLIYGIGKVIAAPFKAISKACSSGRERRREKREEKKKERKGKKAQKQVEKEFDKFHKKCEREEKEVQRDWKKADVEALKKKIWSGEKSESELTKTERYALNQDEEWLIEKEIEDAMYGYDEETDWWMT